MFFIPGWLISILTFPGVIVHEAAHKFFCDLAGVPVYSVCYFRFGNPAGYVIHAGTPNLRASFLISIGPLIVNTILCALLCFSPAIVFDLQPENEPGLFLLLAWLGISVGMHAFPSNQDMDNLSAAVTLTPEKSVFLTVARVCSVLVKIANLLRRIWFDAVYAFLVGWAVPFLLVRLRH